MKEPELRISGTTVSVRSGRTRLAEVGVSDFVRALGRASPAGPDIVVPRGVRISRQQGDVLAVAFEIPPGARRVRWIRDDSAEPFGATASYREVQLAFPFVIVLLVLHRGRLTGQQQLYYRTAPLESADDPLLLPNLYNVAEGYGQRCWLCLQHVRQRPEWTPDQTIANAIDHTFSAAFNRSSDVHEGNSYWERMRDVDPRVASVDAWEEATRADRGFPLGVDWRPAGTSIRREFDTMCAELGAALPPEPSATHLAGLVTRARGARRRR